MLPICCVVAPSCRGCRARPCPLPPHLLYVLGLALPCLHGQGQLPRYYAQAPLPARPPVLPPSLLQVDKGTGADSERVKLKLTLQVEGIEFDAEGV